MAYLQIVDEIRPGEAADTLVVDDDLLAGDLAIDVDRDGRLLGIEIFGPRKQLHREVLDRARPAEG